MLGCCRSSPRSIRSRPCRSNRQSRQGGPVARRASLHRHRRAAAASRRIVTTPAVIAMLSERGGADEFVFTNARGGSVKHSTFWESHWKPACTAVGLSPVPKIHSLRHWGASYMLAQGADLFEVSRALGHGHLHDEQRVRPSGPVPDPPDGDACSEARGAAAHPHGMSNAPTRTGRGRSCRLRSPSPCCPGVPTRASRPPDRRTAPSRGSTRSGSG